MTKSDDNMIHPKLKAWFKEALVTLVLLAVALNLISYMRSPAKRGDPLPELQLSLLNGSSFNTDINRSRPLLVHFWATWCPTCKLEAGAIELISHHFDVLTIAVKSGSNTELERYMYENGYTFAVVNDHDGALAERFNIAAYPSTLMYDPSGFLRFGEVGYTSTPGLYLRMLMAR